MSSLAQNLHPVIAALAEAYGRVAVAVIGALAGRGLRAALLLFAADRGRGLLLGAVRALSVLLYGGLAFGLLTLTRAAVRWDKTAISLAVGAGGLMLVPTLWRWARRQPPRLSVIGVLVRAVVILSILLGGSIALLRVGYLALTEDRPILTVDVTGEVRPQTVRWAPPDQPLREESLRAHRVILRAPTGEPVGETWLYGDQIAVKGRVLRLAPWLNVLGLPNLFELQFAHNGYLTAERHALYPHQAVPLVPMGALSVDPRWRPLRDRLLARWERGGDALKGEPLVRSASTESTYFALADEAGNPVTRRYQLVLTPGGLSGR